MEAKKQYPKTDEELVELRKLRNAINKLVDLDQYSAQFTSHWIGVAIISLSKDPAFEDHPEREEALKMLQLFHARSYDLFKFLEGHEF